MGVADVTGSLSPGKSADFIVLSDNPYEIDIEDVPHITTQQTWFAGRKVFDAKRSERGTGASVRLAPQRA
jgi:predicted amidohydrolase YtcJ